MCTQLPAKPLRRGLPVLTHYCSALTSSESAFEASRSTAQFLHRQLTILESERNRLIPVAAREHWVALFFAVIAGLIFFTSIGLVIFGNLAQAAAAFIATAAPGFLSKVFFNREATVEKRIKEISSDLRESEKAQERLEIIEEALTVVPEEYRERVLEDFVKVKIGKLPSRKTNVPEVAASPPSSCA